MIGYFITNIGLRRCKIFMFKSKKGLIKNSYRLSVHPGVDQTVAFGKYLY